MINIYANQDGGVSITKIKADAKPNQVSIASNPTQTFSGLVFATRTPSLAQTLTRTRSQILPLAQGFPKRRADFQVASARTHVNLRRNTGPRRANKIAAAETAGKGYRADLRKVSPCPTCPFHLPNLLSPVQRSPRTSLIFRAQTIVGLY